MKMTPPLVAAISIAVLFCAGLVYLAIELAGATRDLGAVKSANAALETHMASIQGTIDAFKHDIKQYDSAVGTQGTIQILAKKLESGEMDLSLKSLKIVSNGKALISLGSIPDSGGILQVGASDGTAVAEITSAPGKSKIGFKTTTGADTAQVVRIATFGDIGAYLQRGPSDDVAGRTDGAGFQILDDGADLFLAQAGGGNVSIDTSSADERAKLSLWSEGTPKRIIYFSLGSKDITPFVSVAGAASGVSLTLLPDRLSLANRDGGVVLAAAQDNDGGFVFVNDKSGARRGIMTSGSDGHGSISVFGNDNRSNTLYPEYNIQKNGANQK